MHFHIITLFPEAFESYFGTSMIKRGCNAGKIHVSYYNPRDYTESKNGGVDGKPYGGGPGMVIQALPVIKAVEKAVGRKKNVKVLFFSPNGNQFSNEFARSLSKNHKHIVLICGHYEGIDARVKEIWNAEEVSIGNYVLTGGEIPAMVVVDTVSRFVPGVLGNTASLEEDRVASSDVYTRPESFTYKKKTYTVPPVLLSGNHKEIDTWRDANRKAKK
jgi:tRNA (guanine37-N1)-methyltransferase